MTEAEAVERLATLPLLFNHDVEAIHVLADDLLVQYLKDSGSMQLARAYDQMRDKEGFYYA